MSSRAAVDICIVNYFSAADISRCLEVLGPWPHGRIWLVENSVDAGELAAMRALAGQRGEIELVEPGENLGFGRGCNLAFDRSRAPCFLLLNPDARIAAADVLKLADALQSDDRLAAVSPRIYWNEARSFLLPAAYPQTPAAALRQVLATRRPARARRQALRYLQAQQALVAGPAPQPVDFVAGAVLMLDREAVVRAGGLFDPAYFMFYEDSDLSLRLRRRGSRVGIAPAAAAVHEYRHKPFKARLMAQARDVYFRKHFPLFHRLTAGLARVDALARPVPPAGALPPCATPAEFERATAGAPVLAFSPSPLLQPAIFRAPGAAPGSFSPEDWELLEPGGYTVLLGDARAPRWAYFERTAS